MASYEIKIIDRIDHPNCVKLKVQVDIGGEPITEWFGFDWGQMLTDSTGERICDRNLKEWARRQVALLKDTRFEGRQPKDKAPKKGDKIEFDEKEDAQ